MELAREFLVAFTYPPMRRPAVICTTPSPLHHPRPRKIFSPSRKHRQNHRNPQYLIPVVQAEHLMSFGRGRKAVTCVMGGELFGRRTRTQVRCHARVLAAVPPRSAPYGVRTRIEERTQLPLSRAGRWAEDTLHPTKAVAPMQACAVHLRDRSPNWVALPGRRWVWRQLARPSAYGRLHGVRTSSQSGGLAERFLRVEGRSFSPNTPNLRPESAAALSPTPPHPPLASAAPPRH